MKRQLSRKRAGWLALVAVGVLALMLPGRAVLEGDGFEKSLAPPIPVASDKGDPKLEYALNKYLRLAATEGLDKARAFAESRKFDLDGDQIRVVIEAQTPESEFQTQAVVAFLTDQVKAFGGRVETARRNRIQGYVPPESLRVLAANPHVGYIRLPLKPVPLGVISEGVAKTGANSWKVSPYRKSGQPKIAILDLGFKDYKSVLGTELPASVTTRSFRSDGDIEAGEVHGTACAEIVYDMMPDASFYLVNFSTADDHYDAVNWIVNQGVDIISYSVGWYNAGDGAGNGPICDDVKMAADAGALWVSSAGNEARRHWTGKFSDPNGNSFHNFASDDEILGIYVEAYEDVAFFLNWDDWGTWNPATQRFSGSSQDYDMYMWYWTGSSWLYVEESENWQAGNLGQHPIEFVGYRWSSKSTYWGVSIKKYKTTEDCTLELFTYGNLSSAPCEYNIPEGSLLIPADSEAAIAVGATDCITDEYHVYSSRGPTHDDRIKPDFCAPSGVSTSSVTYGNLGFYGTSAAVPHVAGGLALVFGKTPFTLDQVKVILEKRALDLGPAGKDNQFGVGRLKLTN